MEKLTVEIPEDYLITIAVFGNMGNGQLPYSMKAWAERELVKLGKIDKLVAMKAAKLSGMQKRLENIIGASKAEDINKAIDSFVNLLKKDGGV